MTSEGDLWRRQRRMIQPFFHRRVIESFAETIEREVAKRSALWAVAAATQEPVSITSEMSELTLDIILRSIFGEDLAWLETRMGGNNPFAVVTEHSARDLLFAYKFRSLAKLVVELVAARRAGQWERFDFLQMLMDARDKDDRPMPDREMVDEALTLVVAGHETSASALNWAWYLVATHPAALARLEAEVDAIDCAAVAQPGSAAAAQDNGPRSMTYAASEQLVWTLAVLKEAMRLYPPGWLLTRRFFDDPRRTVWLMGTVVGLATFASIGIYWTRDLNTARALCWIFIPAIYFYIGPCFGLLNNLAMPRMRAMFCAATLFVANVGNLIIAPLYVGSLSNWFDPLHQGTAESLRLALLCLTPVGFWATFHFFMSARRIVQDQTRATGISPI
jgi:hypothetical protein